MHDRQADDPSITDQALIARTAEGDRRAFEQLVERHAAAVLRLATAASDPSTAEDVMQQTFLSVYQQAASFRAEASVRTWLLTIARNTAFRLHGKTQREDLVEEPLTQLGVQAGRGSDDPEAIAIASERKGALRRAMASLSAEDQEVLILRDLEGLRGSEAAEVLGISLRALKSRLHRARLRLAASLRGLGTEDQQAPRGGQP
ncbi:MAG: sigma-70 family RNA polymerase sigma factor [Polyangiales bacterium]